MRGPGKGYSTALPPCTYRAQRHLNYEDTLQHPELLLQRNKTISAFSWLWTLSAPIFTFFYIHSQSTQCFFHLFSSKSSHCLNVLPSVAIVSWQNLRPLVSLKGMKIRHKRCVRSSITNVLLLWGSWTSDKDTIITLKLRCTSNALGWRIITEDSSTESTSSGIPLRLLNSLISPLKLNSTGSNGSSQPVRVLLDPF